MSTDRGNENGATNVGERVLVVFLKLTRLKKKGLKIGPNSSDPLLRLKHTVLWTG